MTLTKSIQRIRLGLLPVPQEISECSPVDLCSQDEIALREAVDLVRPDRNLDFSPSEADVWMVALLLGKFTHAVYEREGFAKVGKRKRLCDVVLFDHPPTVHLLLQGEEFVTL